SRTHSLANKTIIAALHKGTWPVIEGNLSWDANGSPTGSVDLAQWQNGKLLPVYPPAQALAKPTTPKPNWGS
ncbi:MAG: branched-chain amino acid transport system substrate-binding protein, partial [Solirubrobacteraceae bacterium]|nr:branched-chain amino acid transport system substrate-binding protein [Solirubrobacteraceae bacterium]